MAAAVRHIFSSNRHSGDNPPRRKSVSWTRRDGDSEVRSRDYRPSTTDSTESTPPPPPPKDYPPLGSDIIRTGTNGPYVPSSPIETSQNAFRPGHLSRAGSVYSISRISFTSQILQLTTISLPDANVLSKSISSIPTAQAATRALKDAASQIQVWIQKASDVLDGLDAGDDAEWAAAAGKEGVAEVEQATTRFEGLVHTYIAAVEDLQSREDAFSVPVAELQEIVDQVEKITSSWSRIKSTVEDIKTQVDVALEWQQFRDKTLGDVSSEIDALNTSIFELEERRHISVAEPQPPTQDEHFEIGELETMVNDSPMRVVGRLSQNQRSPNIQQRRSSPLLSPTTSGGPDDSALLSLFARMQPLGASLDLLPQQLAKFKSKAEGTFPTACQDLEDGRISLEERWKRLEADAESLRKELGEDRWNSVFRNASRRALKMIDSVERTLTKLDEMLDNDTRLRHAPATVRQIEQYEAKKQHYCPAIERVLQIVETGVKDRLTVNGEILRLRADLRQRWQTLQRTTKSMDTLLEEYVAEGGISQEQLRDSVSTILSNTNRSFTSSALLTPGSSPPSSTGISRSGSVHSSTAPQPYSQGKPRQAVATPSTPVSTPPNTKRLSSLPVPINRRTPLSRSSANGSRSPAGGLSSSPLSASSTRITSNPLIPFPKIRAATPSDNRPRWSYSNQGGDYNVNEYYQRLKNIGSSNKNSPSPRQSLGAPTSDVVNRPKPSSSSASATPTRQPLHRKRSDNILSSSTRSSDLLSTPKSTPRSKTAMGSHPQTPMRTPVRKKGVVGAADGSSRRTPSIDRGGSMLPVPTSPTNTTAGSMTVSLSGSGWNSPVNLPVSAGNRSRRTSGVGSAATTTR